MIYLVLYDSRGQCQRVASVSSREQANVFSQAGFQEVDKQEYDRCSALVPEVTTNELPNIRQATTLLGRINQQAARQIVSVVTNTDALERLTARQREKLLTITDNYLSGALTAEQWFRQMTDANNAGNVATTILGVGGIENLSAQDRQEIERANATQSGYLTRFRRELENLTPAMIRNRASLYAGALTARYWTAHTRAQGLVLPAMPGVRTSCGSNCKCNWDIRKLSGNGNWDCVWRLSAIESCEECLRRQRVFNPLQVRNFIVQPFNPSGIYR